MCCPWEVLVLHPFFYALYVVLELRFNHKQPIYLYGKAKIYVRYFFLQTSLCGIILC